MGTGLGGCGCGTTGLDKGDIDEITEVLRSRLEGSGEMYTSIGDNVLVALNPYSSLAKAGCPLYDDKVALHYWRRSPHLTAPHVYKHVRVQPQTIAPEKSWVGSFGLKLIHFCCSLVCVHYGGFYVIHAFSCLCSNPVQLLH